jgi:dTMP kinase
MSEAPTQGKFITLEGGEGTGKSTQVSMLAAALEASGHQVIVTREPGGSPGAEEIRKLLVEGSAGRWDPMSEALLHFAARHDHLRHTILPAIAAGKWVVSDRFADSTMAYQGHGHGLGREAIEELYELAVGDFSPDLTLILDIEVSIGLSRAALREANSQAGETRYEEMPTEFHQRMRDGFLDISVREPDRCVVIDAAGSVETVAREILAAAKSRLF